MELPEDARQAAIDCLLSTEAIRALSLPPAGVALGTGAGEADAPVLDELLGGAPPAGLCLWPTPMAGSDHRLDMTASSSPNISSITAAAMSFWLSKRRICVRGGASRLRMRRLQSTTSGVIQLQSSLSLRMSLNMHKMSQDLGWGLGTKSGALGHDVSARGKNDAGTGKAGNVIQGAHR